MLQITAVGYLAANPDFRETGSGREVTNFRLLVNKKVQDDDIVNEIKCSVWGARAKVAADYLKVGSQITVTGQAYIETFDRKNGDKGACLNVNVNEFTLPVKPKAAADDADMPF
jgi:single-strand DNA-binding protein